MTIPQYTRASSIVDSMKSYEELQNFLAKFDDSVKITLTYNTSTTTSVTANVNAVIRTALIEAVNATVDSLRAEFEEI